MELATREHSSAETFATFKLEVIEKFLFKKYLC